MVIVILAAIIGLLMLYILTAPIAECEYCLHCRYIKLEQFRKKQQDALKQEQLQSEYEHENNLIIPEECQCSKCQERIRRRTSG